MSFQQFQITVTLYKLVSFNSQFARLSWVTLVNITKIYNKLDKNNY